MSDKAFVDTNILIYCYAQDEADKRKKAIEAADQPETYISTQVLTELSNTLQEIQAFLENH